MCHTPAHVGGGGCREGRREVGVITSFVGQARTYLLPEPVVRVCGGACLLHKRDCIFERHLLAFDEIRAHLCEGGRDVEMWVKVVMVCSEGIVQAASSLCGRCVSGKETYTSDGPRESSKAVYQDLVALLRLPFDVLGNVIEEGCELLLGAVVDVDRHLLDADGQRVDNHQALARSQDARDVQLTQDPLRLRCAQRPQVQALLDLVGVQLVPQEPHSFGEGTRLHLLLVQLAHVRRVGQRELCGDEGVFFFFFFFFCWQIDDPIPCSLSMPTSPSERPRSSRSG